VGPLRDIVLLNAAGALIVAGRARDLRDGVTQAGKAIASGNAKRALERLIAITNATPT
jgi:anthranilate phosphoribosyltransferase